MNMVSVYLFVFEAILGLEHQLHIYKYVNVFWCFGLNLELIEDILCENHER